MPVYVDDMLLSASVGSLRAKWSHMVADTTSELHVMADALGLKRSWFQSPSAHGWHWHYDLVASKRKRALALGALPISVREAAQLGVNRRAVFQKMTSENTLPVIGLTLAEAVVWLDDFGLLHRLLSVDGVLRPVSRDIKSNRVSLVISSNTVASFTVG
jgi:hypothetical protein